MQRLIEIDVSVPPQHERDRAVTKTFVKFMNVCVNYVKCVEKTFLWETLKDAYGTYVAQRERSVCM